MGRGAAFFLDAAQRHKWAIWLYFAGALCYAEGRKVGIAMWEKIKRYRPVWLTIVITLVLAWLALLPEYHVRGTAEDFAQSALHYAGSSDGKLPEVGKTVQQQKIDGRMVVTFARTDGSPEFGAAVFQRGWNGMWKPVRAVTNFEYPIGLIRLSDDHKTAVAFAANCPDDAVQWGLIDDMHIIYSTSTGDAAALYPVPGSTFIQRVDLPDGTFRMALYNEEGRELTEDVTGQPGGGTSSSIGYTAEFCCVLVLLFPPPLAVVRFVLLRRRISREKNDG